MRNFLLFVALARSCFSYPSGAPLTTCESLTPIHNVSSQESDFPYNLKVSSSEVKGGESVLVELQAEGDLTFKGFLIQARSEVENWEILGEFFDDESNETPFNYRDCLTGVNNAVTHADNDTKQQASFYWRAPENFEGTIRFHATVVRDKETFWVNHESNIIAITLPDNNVYTECGKTKSCFGVPDGCIATRNCVSFGAVIVQEGTYSFEMLSSRSADFIALALSFDHRMGEDSAIECVKAGSQVQIFTSITRAIPNDYGARRSDVDQNIIRLVNSELVDGSIYCLVERNEASTVDGLEFNLANNSYFLLMASGSTHSELSVGYHDITRDVSTESIRFSEDVPIIIRPTSEQASKTLVLLHGSLMIISWIGATSIGVFSARFMKKLWSGKQAFGKDIWFIVHQVSMSLTWALTITAVIIICLDVGEWRTSTHSVLGIIATALCFIQPLTAFFRPAPDDDARVIFNFMHGSVGKLAHFLAVITIFFATSMARAELPLWTKYVLISYVVVYLIFYAVLTNLGFVSDIKYKQLGENFNQNEKHEIPLLTPRRIMFIIFSIFMLGFVITLINAVVL